MLADHNETNNNTNSKLEEGISLLENRSLSTTLEVPKMETHKSSSSAMSKSSLHQAFKMNSSLSSLTYGASQNQIKDDTPVMIKYAAYWVNKKDNNKIYNVNVELPHLESVGEAVRDVLPLLIQKLNEENSSYTLVDDPNQFDLYKAKKTGEPKLDYPALDFTQILNQTAIRQISLVEKNSAAVISKLAVSRSPSKTKDFSKDANGMVDTTSALRSTSTTAGISLLAASQEPETETCCFCFKRNKRFTNNENDLDISMQQPNHSQNQSLLSNKY